MPNYDFICECELIIDKIVKFEDKDKEVICPNCGEKMKRLVCAPSVMGNTYSAPAIGTIKPFTGEKK